MCTVEKVYLAPMEGVCDPPLRKILCAYGGYDECFSEFIRVTDQVLPAKTLLRDVPELLHDGKTDDGTPVRVQLLGDNAKAMAQSAQRAVSLGARSIDLNFGCPSRFVHHAGAMLLKEPELIHRITATVREALDPTVFLSVKMRLGFADIAEAPALVQAVCVPGLNELILHARTRSELYRKDALHWEVLAQVQAYMVDIPLVANGDIVDQDSAQCCMQKTKCRRLMVGRAAMAQPNLARMLKDNMPPLSFRQKLALIPTLFAQLSESGFAEKSRLDRAKQYLGFVRRSDSAAAEFFKTFCHVKTQAEALALLKAQGVAIEL